MTLGLVLLVGGFFAFVLVGVPVAFALMAISSLTFKTTTDLPLWIFLQRVFNGLDSFVLVCIPFFLLTGNLMNQSGITDRLIKFAHAMVGHIRGGLAHVNVVVSMIFAGISGSSTADTAGIGSVLIPAMIKRGYSEPFTIAVTAASSTLGVIIPPSIMMVVYSAVTGTSVAALFLGGAIPGICIGVGQMILSYIYALKYDYPRESRVTLRQFFAAFGEAFLPMGTPVIIIGGVVGGIFTATEASVIAALYSLFLGMVVYRTLHLRDLPKILLNTALLSSLSLFCLAGAAPFGWLLAYNQVPQLVGRIVFSISHNPVVIMFMMMVVFLIVGTFMDALPAIMILAPVFQPIALKAGIHPIHLGVLTVVNLAYGLITPPYGLCLLLACSIAKYPLWKAFGTVAVFLGIMLILLVLMVLVPDIVMFLPRLIVPKFV